MSTAGRHGAQGRAKVREVSKGVSEAGSRNEWGEPMAGLRAARRAFLSDVPVPMNPFLYCEFCHSMFLRIDANGVTPIPAPTNITCGGRKRMGTLRTLTAT